MHFEREYGILIVMLDSVWRRRHALTVFLYYVIGFSGMIIVSHPVFLLCMWVVLVLTEITEVGLRVTGKSLMSNLIFAVIILILNLLINHRGPTTLFVISDLRFTWESLLYGMRMALIFLTAMRLFMLFSRAMSEEKLLSMMAGRLPGLTLLFSMILRLVPSVRKDAGELKKHHGRGPRVWMKLLSMTMEDGIVRSISMNERGYKNIRKRTSIYRRSLSAGDGIGIFFMLIWLGGLITMACLGEWEVRFFPTIYMKDVSPIVLSIWGIYYMVPLILKGKEVFSWQRSKRRIIHTDMPMMSDRL